MQEISVIILTYNEEVHIRRCLENLKKLTPNIFLVDSFSSDATVAIARELGVEVYQNKWENSHAKQLNWGLDNLPIKTPWVLRMDADEYLTPELITEIQTKLPTIGPEVSGITLVLRRVFLGRHIKRGGTGKIPMLRLFRHEKARCEMRWMDEHMQITDGTIVDFEGEFADHNLNNIIWWTGKHNAYAIKEAIELLDLEFNLFQDTKDSDYKHHGEAKTRRDRKISYARKPLFVRSFAYFIYRYIFKLGFTEGKEGFLWHFLQGWWYRTLVDTIIYEVKKNCGNNPDDIRSYFYKVHKIKL